MEEQLLPLLREEGLTASVYTQLSDVEQVPDSFGARLGEAFRNGWSSFTNGLENLAVALAYGWMWVLVLAVAAVAVIRVLRRRRRARKAQQKQESPAQK